MTRVARHRGQRPVRGPFLVWLPPNHPVRTLYFLFDLEIDGRFHAETGKNGPKTGDWPGNGQTRCVAVSTNLTATKRTVRALRRPERVGEADAAAICLAESTAGALDAALSAGAGPSAVAALARAHGAALAALREETTPTPDNLAFERLMADALRPTPGSPADPWNLPEP